MCTQVCMCDCTVVCTQVCLHDCTVVCVRQADTTAITDGHAATMTAVFDAVVSKGGWAWQVSSPVYPHGCA